MKKSLSNILRIIFWSIFILIFAIGAFLWWAVGEKLPKRIKLDIETNDSAIPPPFKHEITVVSYNIGHGQGVKVNSWDHKDKDVTLKKLDELSEVMKNLSADVYLLQEVDLDSNRTQNIDQINYLKKRTNYPFHACAMVWQKNYVAYPFWPPSHHIGYVRSANCILSKYKLSNHERLIFDKPKNNPWWYNLGYIDRGLQRVDVELGTKKLAILNVHLEAWDMSAREEQIKVIKNYIEEINLPIILGGDFNTIMPSDPIKTGFVDEPDADFKKENTFVWLFKEMPELKAPKSILDYTFPSDKATRRLDHIFLFGKDLSFLDFRVVKEAKTASDHLPVEAKVRIAL